jgi:hypothetical protein
VDAALADHATADLGAHVLGHDVQADVGEDEVPDVFTQGPAVVHLDRGDAQGFLPDFGGPGVVTSAHVAAHVGLVAFDGAPGYELALEEDGLVHGHVVVLVAHGKDVVVEDDVALVDVVAEVADDVLAHGL